MDIPTTLIVLLVGAAIVGWVRSPTTAGRSRRSASGSSATARTGWPHGVQEEEPVHFAFHEARDPMRRSPSGPSTRMSRRAHRARRPQRTRRSSGWSASTSVPAGLAAVGRGFVLLSYKRRCYAAAEAGPASSGGGIGVGEAFFTEVAEPIRFERPRLHRPARVQGLRPRPARPRQADGGPPPDRRLLLALVRLGRARTCSGSARSTGRGCVGAGDPMARRAARRWPPPSSSSRSSASRTTASTTATSRPRARPSPSSATTSTRSSTTPLGYQERTGVRLLWGTANLFTHPRYQAGAATNPDPEVFAYAAAQVKHMLEVTQRLGGENYVLWGGREGYDTLLNTDLRREGEQLARFLHLVAEHKHKIGFDGPAAHRAQADGADQAPVRLRLGDRPRLPRPARPRGRVPASTSRPTTRRWPATASTTRSRTRSPTGILGSIDANRGDPQNGWDTDQFPNSVEDLALPLYEILRARRVHARRLQLRRQAAPPEHRPDRPVPRPHRRHRHARPGAARRGRPDRARRRSADASRRALRGLGRAARAGDPRRRRESLESLEAQVAAGEIDPRPVSGRQELLENLVNQRDLGDARPA